MVPSTQTRVRTRLVPPKTVRATSSKDAGQAAVEAALTLPLFMFVLLGTLQLALMHQARLLTKYAAYKAVRVGAMTSADLAKMERAALAVLVPTISNTGNSKGVRVVNNIASGGDFASTFSQMSQNIMLDAAGMKYVEIMICSPTKELLGGGDEHDFDSESATGSAAGRQGGPMQREGWREFDRGRLAIQVTYNYRMIIPFADMVLYLIATGQEKADLLWALKLGKLHQQSQQAIQQHAARAAKYNSAAQMGLYLMPIRANYVMRMHSSLFPNAEAHKLPQTNECVLRFAKEGDGGGGGNVDLGGGGGDDTDQDTPPADPE